MLVTFTVLLSSSSWAQSAPAATAEPLTADQRTELAGIESRLGELGTCDLKAKSKRTACLEEKETLEARQAELASIRAAAGPAELPTGQTSLELDVEDE